MSITFFIQWYQWVNQGDFNWSEFDVITLSFERDKAAKDWGVDVALLGFGFHIHNVSRASAEFWADMLDENKNGDGE